MHGRYGKRSASADGGKVQAPNLTISVDQRGASTRHGDTAEAIRHVHEVFARSRALLRPAATRALAEKRELGQLCGIRR